ncbi:MAG: tRNA (adenosine(37)-N6)-dimethylallyltransferase MiaA [Dehalococcoidia bacterium]|nr:tRNA (adenosine(37)-N6)-dimethylallyltransferase MiaA [Dehalococcoidia bacterium]
MPPVIAVVGPTAVGKSGLALALATAVGGEIVNADSRQVYRHMAIGTAKPGLSERGAISHHLYDIVDPDGEFSLALYHRMVGEAFAGIGARGKIAFLVGGSGQYVWSVIEGWQVPVVTPQPELRRLLEAEAGARGVESLHRELERVDPDAARKIDPRNVRRVVRAIEVHRVTGKRFSELARKTPPQFHVLVIGLTADRAELYRRIDLRVDGMVEQGLVAEVEGLVKRGYGLELPAMSGLGYKQIGTFLKGKIDLPTAIQQVKNETHRFARQQYAWFRLKDERIRWLDIGGEVEKPALELVRDFLRAQQSVMA